jgi:hypothetical protein
LLSQSGCSFPKSRAPSTQSFLQYDAVLGFGAPPVLGGPTFQCFNNILGNVSYQELRHIDSATSILISHDIEFRKV